MILAAMLMLIQDVPAIAPRADEEIVVIARKLGYWRGYFNIRGRDGQISCVTKKSSGDPQIDAVGCEALTACVQRNQAEILAAADRKLPARRRKEMQTASNKMLGACLSDERGRLIGELAERRALAQQGEAK